MPTYKDYRICSVAKDGEHIPDPKSAVVADGLDWVIDVHCKLCGVSGSVCIDPRDIRWE